MLDALTVPAPVRSHALIPPPRFLGLPDEWRYGPPPLAAVERHAFGDEGWGPWCRIHAGGGMADRVWLRAEGGLVEQQSTGLRTALPLLELTALAWWCPSTVAGDLSTWAALGEGSAARAGSEPPDPRLSRRASRYAHGFSAGGGHRPIEFGDDPDWMRGWTAGRAAFRRGVAAERARLGLGPALVVHLAAAGEAAGGEAAGGEATGREAAGRTTSRELVVSHIWDRDLTHASYRFTLRDPASDAWLHADHVVTALAEAAGLEDGDGFELLLRANGRRPFGRRWLRVVGDGKYERDGAGAKGGAR